MVLLLGLPQEKASLSQPNSPPFWKALLTAFCHGMAYPDWCYREEGSGPSLPQGVTWALNGGNWAGLGWEGEGTGPATLALKPTNLYTTIKTSPW